jgi:hypothetical protein
MPVVKVPGTDREIFFELHDPKETESLLFATIAEPVQLPPEQFVTEMGDPASDWIFLPPVLAQAPTKARIEIEKSARRFQKSRVRKGRPFAHGFSRAEDFAVMVLYFESRGYKQSTKEARVYWDRHDQHCPTARQIEEALRIVRAWEVIDLERTVQSIRKKYRLKAAVPRKIKRPI